MLLHQHFIDIAKRHGKKLAINDFSTGKKVTYSRALIGALLLCEVFKKLDEEYIGIMIPTSAGCVLTKLGILFSGKVPVMINYSTGAEKNALYARKKCAFKTIITSRAFLEKINCPALDNMLFLEDIMDGFSTSQKLKASLIANLPAGFIKQMVHQGSGTDTSVILLTSGSEKDPKAVQLSHNNIGSNLVSISQRYHFNHEDVFLASLPFFHVFGLTANLWLPIFHGMTSLSYANPLDFKKICTIVREEQATFMVGTPSFYWGYLRKSEPGDFKNLRTMLCGADKCPESLRDGFIKKHDMILYEAYGATETSPAISGNSPEHNKPGSVGLPFPNTRVRIVHHESGEELGPGQDGKILVKSDSVMMGYLHDPEETSRHIKDGWYDTGDMGHLDEDGYLWHVGRLKRFVKIGGEMISLVNIEAVLNNLLDEDVECCVVGIPDKRKGSRIIAVVTDQIDVNRTLDKLAEHLPSIAIPKKFIIKDELPKMGSGKIDFRKITQMAEQEAS